MSSPLETPDHDMLYLPAYGTSNGKKEARFDAQDWVALFNDRNKRHPSMRRTFHILRISVFDAQYVLRASSLQS